MPVSKWSQVLIEKKKLSIAVESFDIQLGEGVNTKTLLTEGSVRLPLTILFVKLWPSSSHTAVGFLGMFTKLREKPWTIESSFPFVQWFGRRAWIHTTSLLKQHLLLTVSHHLPFFGAFFLYPFLISSREYADHRGDVLPAAKKGESPRCLICLLALGHPWQLCPCSILGMSPVNSGRNF